MKEKIKLKSSSKGITLIALVITIIVLLILAGVSIATLVGENGILTRANNASKAQIEGQVKEEVRLAVQAVKIYAEEMSTKTAEGWLASGNIGETSTETEYDDLTIAQRATIIGQLRYDLTVEKGYKIISNEGTGVKVTYQTDAYKKATNNANAKIEIEVTITNNTFTIGEGTQNPSNPTDPSDPVTPPTSTLPSIEGVTTPYLPDATAIVIENSTLDTGLVVKDKKDNEWVWIQVPKTIYASGVTATDYEGIYNALNTYAATYREGKKGQGYYWSDEWYDGSNVVGYVETTIADEAAYEEAVEAGTLYINKAGIEATSGRYSSSSKYYIVNASATLTNTNGCGLSCSKYTENYKKMLTSVFTNGGFWIARYEAGIEGTTGAIVEGDTSISSLGRTSHKNITATSPKAISQKNAIPYNYVYCSEAQILASAMSPDSTKTSSLMFGIQWDLVCKYLEGKDGLVTANINENSVDWGNYSNKALTIDNENAKQYSSSKWSAKTGEKSASVLLLSTGASTTTKKMNIYDFAGNELEWTLEHATTNASVACANRGGSYYDYGTVPASDRYGLGTAYSNDYIAFRPALY